MTADTPTSRAKSDADQGDAAKSESECVGDGALSWWPSGAEVPTPGEVRSRDPVWRRQHPVWDRGQCRPGVSADALRPQGAGGGGGRGRSAHGPIRSKGLETACRGWSQSWHS